MSDMEETEGHVGPAAPHRVIGTPPPSPRLLGSTAVAEGGDGAGEVAEAEGAEHIVGLPPDDPRVIVHAKRVERIVAACFTFAFIAGCGFIAAYVGLGVHSVDKTLRSNLALGTSLSLALVALGLGALLWVRHLMPDVEVVEERHELRSDPKDRQAFEEYFKEGAANSQFVKRPLVRRTLMLGTLPLLATRSCCSGTWARCPGPACGTRCGARVGGCSSYGTNQPITPAAVQRAGQRSRSCPTAIADDPDALDQGHRHPDQVPPGELNIPTTTQGGTLIGTMNWTVDNIVAYSKICTHVGCPVALYEQTTHHILCPCHQSTFDASTGATVIFGPAPRPLPQLPMTVDAQGYLVAKSDFTQPVGPSFWERG